MTNCLFCKIIDKQIPAAIVYEDDRVLIIKDLNPQAPVHLLAMPKKHYSGVHEVPKTDGPFFIDLFRAIGAIVKKENLTGNGYRLVLNSGEKAGQSVPHIHVHILSGRELQWPPG